VRIIYETCSTDSRREMEMTLEEKIEAVEKRVRAECYEEIGQLKDSVFELKAQLFAASIELNSSQESCGMTIADNCRLVAEVGQLKDEIAQLKQTCIDHAEIQNSLLVQLETEKAGHAAWEDEHLREMGDLYREINSLKAALVECVEALLHANEALNFSSHSAAILVPNALTNARSVLGGE